jgi:RHS repeat-associated protein
MHIKISAAIVLLAVGTARAEDRTPPVAPSAAPRLGFVPNVGQFDPKVRFAGSGAGVDLYLTDDGLVMGYEEPDSEAAPARRARGGHSTPALRRGGIRMKVVGGSLAGKAVGIDPLPGVFNYLLGSDASKWRRGVPHYARVEVQQVAPGIQLVLHNETGRLEYDFEVAPGADPSRVSLDFEGARSVAVSPEGDLVLKTAKGEIRHRRPAMFQEKDGEKQTVTGRFTMKPGGHVGLEVQGSYDHKRRLVIDPTIEYIKPFPASNADGASSVSTDGDGNVYMGGSTRSLDFLHTVGGVPGSITGNPPRDTGFIMKLTPSGIPVYSTFLGGSFADDIFAIVADVDGAVYATGASISDDFPIVGGYQTVSHCAPNCENAFVSKIDPSGGTLLYSTYLGGSVGNGNAFQPVSLGLGIALDPRGAVYVTGRTEDTDFPTTPGSFQDTFPQSTIDQVGRAFVSKFDTTKTAAASLAYSTYVGGLQDAEGDAIAVDAAGYATVVGLVVQPNPQTDPGFPLKNPLRDRGQGFVLKVTSTGSKLVYSTLLGPGARVANVAVDADGNAWVTGFTNDSTLPTARPAQAQLSLAPGATPPYPYDAFLLRLDAVASRVVFGTYYGTPISEVGKAVAVDDAGNAYMLYRAASGDSDFAEHIVKFGPLGNVLTHLDMNYGVAAALTVDGSGSLYWVGSRRAVPTDPATADAFLGKAPNGLVDPDDPSCRCGPNTPNPINIATGNMFLDQTDIAIPTVGEPLVLSRSYNSRNAAVVGPFGQTWSTPYDRSLRPRSGGVLALRGADGVVSLFKDPNKTGRFTPTVPSNPESSIQVQADGSYVHQFRSGARDIYDAAGRLTSTVDPLGNTTTLGHDPDTGALTSITAPGGRALTLTYDKGVVSEVTGPGAKSIARYVYDDPGRLKTVTYSDNTGYGFTYNDANQLLQVTDAAGRVLESHQYDGDKATTSDIGSGQEHLNLVYQDGVTTVTDAAGLKTVYEWAEFGGMKRVVRETRSTGSGFTSGIAPEVEESTYDPAGRVTSHRDPEGVLTTYAYNDRGDLASETDGAGTPFVRTTSYAHTYDPDTGRILTTVRTATGEGATTTTYDLAGPTRIEREVGGGLPNQVTTYTYTPAGQLETVKDPRGQTTGKVTAYTYTPEGDLETVTDPLDHKVTYGYNSFGWRTTVTDHLNHSTTTTYDDRARVTSVSPPPNPTVSTTTFGYDQHGQRTKVIDALGRTTQYAYDDAGRLTAVVDAALGATRYSYDPMSRMTSLVDAKGQSTAFERDARGRVTRTILPGGPSETATYDRASRVTTRVDRKGITTTYIYDTAGRLQRTTYSDGTPDVVYDYDPAWRLASVSNGTDTITRTYDLAGRVLTETSVKNGSTLTYTYDENGNRKTLGLDGASFLAYGYDDASRLTSITAGTQAFGLGYDEVNRRTSLTYPNTVVTSYSYDERSQLLTMGASLGANVLTHFTYGYDAVGNRTSRQALDVVEAYGYDALYRLTSIDRTGLSRQWRYGYDSVGNRTNAQVDGAVTTASYDVRNELLSVTTGGTERVRGTLDEAGTVMVAGQPARTLSGNVFEQDVAVTSGTNSVTVEARDGSGNMRTNTYQFDVTGGSVSYTYDPNGNVATKTEGSDVWTFAWNARNELVRVEKNGAEIARFAYDGLGRRVEKVAGGVAMTYAYDGDDILRQTTGGIVTRYIHGPGVDEPLAQADSIAAIVFYFHADGLGSIVATTNAAGAVTSTRRYDAYGNLEIGADQPGYSFTGREWDPETGLYYYRARYYDAELGRFLSEDPTGLQGGIDFYAYAHSDPINFVDPTGLSDVNLLNAEQRRAGDSFHRKDPELLSVVAHSVVYEGENEPFAFDDQSTARPHRIISVAQLARKIRQTDKWKAGKVKTILLLSCNVGTGDNSLAQRLANMLGVLVIGVSGGRVEWVPRLADDEYGGFMPDPEDNGAYKPFRPHRRQKQ